MERLAYSIKEAAELTGLSARTITRQIQRGTLRAVRVSRRIVIPADALTKLLGCNIPETTAGVGICQAGGHGGR